MIKRTHFMPPCKMINLFEDVVTKFFPKNVSYEWRCPQDHENKLSRPSAIFMTNRTQLKSKNNKLLRLQISTVCQEN